MSWAYAKNGLQKGAQSSGHTLVFQIKGMGEMLDILSFVSNYTELELGMALSQGHARAGFFL
jgi:hypothetical protein